MNRAVITGIGIVSPAGTDEATFRAAVRQGRCPVAPLLNVRVPSGQRAVGAPLREDEDRQGRAYRMLLAACRQAIDGAELPTEGQGLAAAMFVGTSLGDIDTALHLHHEHLVSGQVADTSMLDCQPEQLVRLLGNDLSITGPHITLSCACTSGTSALGMALDWIRLGRASRCLVCGVDTLNEFVLCGFSSLWALTSDIPRPFDRSRSGMALGEAAAAFLVEEEGLARKRAARIRAGLEGYGASGDAVHITAPDRKGGGAARALKTAIDDAGWSVGDVEYLNVHATGSVFNDTMVLRALETVFEDRASSLPTSSVNPVTGHTLGAAGLVEAVATVLCVEAGFIPPTANLEDPEQENLELVRGAAIECPISRAVSLTTGFGGANTALSFSRGDGGAR